MARAKPSRARHPRAPAGLLTPTQYARRRGISKQGVAKAMASGRIPIVLRGGRRLIDPAAADAAWSENTDPTKPKGPRGNGSAPPAPGTQAAEALRLTGIRARTLELELKVREGELVEARAVELHFQKLAREARDKFLALADRLGLELAPITDPREATLRMRQEFVHFLDEMTDDEKQDQRARASG